MVRGGSPGTGLTCKSYKGDTVIETSTIGCMRRPGRRLTGLPILAVAVSALTLWLASSSAANDNAISQAQRYCERAGAPFFDSSTYPDFIWSCQRSPSLTEKQLAHLARICDRSGGSFESGYDGMRYFANCRIT